MLGLSFAGLAAVVWVAPSTPARSWPVVAQLVALDRPTVVLAVLVAVSLTGVALFRRARELWLPAVAVAAIALLFGARVVAQGVGVGEPPSTGGLVAIAWNADGVASEVIADTVGQLRDHSGADVIVLPETAWKGADIVGELLADHGDPLHVFAPQGSTASVMMSPALAASYRLDESTPPWAGVTLRPETPSAATPIIVATHLQQPSLGNTSTWLEHLAWVQQVCDSSPYVIVLGDMNTTLNHLEGATLGACRDVSATNAAGAAATWPTWLPAWMGISIDRFMIGGGYDATTATFMVERNIPLGGADHWPIVGSFDTAQSTG